MNRVLVMAFLLFPFAGLGKGLSGCRNTALQQLSKKNAEASTPDRALNSFEPLVGRKLREFSIELQYICCGYSKAKDDEYKHTKQWAKNLGSELTPVQQATLLKGINQYLRTQIRDATHFSERDNDAVHAERAHAWRERLSVMEKILDENAPALLPALCFDH